MYKMLKYKNLILPDYTSYVFRKVHLFCTTNVGFVHTMQIVKHLKL